MNKTLEHNEILSPNIMSKGQVQMAFTLCIFRSKIMQLHREKKRVSELVLYISDGPLPYLAQYGGGWCLPGSRAHLCLHRRGGASFPYSLLESAPTKQQVHIQGDWAARIRVVQPPEKAYSPKPAPLLGWHTCCPSQSPPRTALPPPSLPRASPPMLPPLRQPTSCN